MELRLKDGTSMPKLGQGTWHMGENPAVRKREIDALRLGVELGMTMIDTAEMYGEGLAEELTGEAVSPFPRGSLYLVSKVYPWNAGRSAIFTSCENSLRRMRTDYLDLYLLHWMGSVPFEETIECMERLKEQGKIRSWGVSNLDTADMRALLKTSGGDGCVTDQVLYHLGSRGVEYDLYPYLSENEIALTAYCPLAQSGRLRSGLFTNPAVVKTALDRGVSESAVLLAFLLSKKNVAVIPKASDLEHVRQNAQAAALALTSEELPALDAAFPAPARKVPLDMQ